VDAQFEGKDHEGVPDDQVTQPVQQRRVHKVERVPGGDMQDFQVDLLQKQKSISDIE